MVWQQQGSLQQWLMDSCSKTHMWDYLFNFHIHIAFFAPFQLVSQFLVIWNLVELDKYHWRNKQDFRCDGAGAAVGARAALVQR